MKQQPRYAAMQTRQYEEYPRCLQCGGEIPYEKRRYEAQFCSRDCWREQKSGPPTPCANPECTNLLRKVPVAGKYCSEKCRMAVQKAPIPCDRPGCRNLIPEDRRTPSYIARSQYHYCSRACRVEHAQQLGLLKAAAAKGHEAQRQYKEEHGAVPGIEQRREAALRNAEKGRAAMKKKREQGE